MHTTKTVLDAGSAATAMAAVFHAAPDIAACLATGWYVIRITEWLYQKRTKEK